MSKIVTGTRETS